MRQTTGAAEVKKGVAPRRASDSRRHHPAAQQAFQRHGWANVLPDVVQDVGRNTADQLFRRWVNHAAAGIKDLLTKSLGSANKINNAYATIMALSQLRLVEKSKSTKAKTTRVAKPKSEAAAA